jgi:hypothetical protein
MKNLLIFLFVFSLSGCAGISKVGAKINSYMPWYKNNQVEQIHIFVKPSDTLHRALKVDAIFAYNDVSKAVIEALEPQEWFAKRSSFIANLANNIDVIKWEVVPATQQSSQNLPKNHRDAIAVYIFANNPNNKFQITEIENSLISLDDTSISVQSLPLKKEGAL